MEAPQNLGFPFNIFATTEGTDFKIGRQVGFGKAHHKMPPRKKWVWSWARGAPQIFGVPYNMFVTAEAIDIKFGMQLEFADAPYEITPREKTNVDRGYVSSPQFGVPL